MPVDKLCNKYLGDNDGTCPQLTCVRDAGHAGLCDNVTGDHPKPAPCCLASVWNGTHSLECTARGLREALNATAPTPIRNIFSARIKRAVPDLSEDFATYRDACNQIDEWRAEADEVYERILESLSALILGAEDDDAIPPAAQAFEWFKQRGFTAAQLAPMERAIERKHGKSKKPWNRLLAEAIVAGFMTMIDDDDEGDDDVSSGPDAG